VERLEALENAVQQLTDVAWPRLLDPHVPPDEPVAVLADPAMLPFADLDRKLIAVPPEAAGGAAGIARLVAQEVQGLRFVLVPEPARDEVDQDAYLSERLRTHFRNVASEPGVGTLYEAGQQKDDAAEVRALTELIDSLGLSDRDAPMLDWTSLGLASALPGRTVFQPVEPAADLLPHLGHTIDVVLVDDADLMDEAERVAADAAVLVKAEGGGMIATETRRIRPETSSAAAPVLILVAPDADNEWMERVSESVAGRAGAEVRVVAGSLTAAVETDAPIVVLAERGVLPLPRCIEAAERLLAANDRVGGVAVKLFGADGSLEAAGGAAFADGSVEAIATGAAAAAPWHEYVRPVAAAMGLVVLRSDAAVDGTGGDGTPFDLTALSARLWAAGWELHYQPDAAAVRVHPAADGYGVWPQGANRLPARPTELDHLAWRRLLAQNEVGAAR
jgi:hypothetical protein